MREASNGEKIAERIKDKTGIDLRIISGDLEAEIIFDNHFEKLLSTGDHNYLYIDVGGGSTEMILMNDSEMVDKWSFNIGTLRIKHDMVPQKTWNEMRSWLYQFRNRRSIDR